MTIDTENKAGQERPIVEIRIIYINRAEDHLDDGIYKIYFQLRGVRFSPFFSQRLSLFQGRSNKF